MKTYIVNNESLEWLKFGESGSQTFWWIKVWQIYHEVNKTSCGLIVSWWMKVWQILSIHQICQTLATPKFCRLWYVHMQIKINFQDIFRFRIYEYLLCETINDGGINLD